MINMAFFPQAPNVSPDLPVPSVGIEFEEAIAGRS
jgi:hypothetical protein